MMELRGKAVADAHKAVLNERLVALESKGTVLTLGILLVGDDKAAQMYAHFMEKQLRVQGLPLIWLICQPLLVLTKWLRLLNGGIKQIQYMVCYHSCLCHHKLIEML